MVIAYLIIGFIVSLFVGRGIFSIMTDDNSDVGEIMLVFIIIGCSLFFSVLFWPFIVGSYLLSLLIYSIKNRATIFKGK